MRIAFGTTRLELGHAQKTVDGIGSYTRELHTHLNKIPSLQIQPFTFGKVDSVPPECLNLGSFGPQALFAYTTGLPFPVAVKRIPASVDLLHATDHLIPTVRQVPVVATLMDAIPLSHPEWARASFRRTKNTLWVKFAHQATHIITISNYSKHELIRHFRLPAARISVIPLGVNERWFAPQSATALARVKERYSLPQRFFLFLGTIQPRKNLARLLQAHKRLPYRIRKECPLLIVGRVGWGCEKEVADISAIKDGTIQRLNYVHDSDLVPLVSQATSLVFPSLHEGFGLPVLEAFAAGVPVIAANTTSLPEVAADAALLIDPHNIDALADAMHLILNDQTLSRRLREQGKARARTFTWDQTAAQTASVYARVLASF